MTIKKDIFKNIGKYSTTVTTPFYLYNTDLIREHCRKFHAIPYPHKSIHFATMANINPDFLEIIKKEGFHVFVNSIEHLSAVIAKGFQQSQIIFTASALNEKTMVRIQESEVQANLDSPLQLQQWLNLFPDQAVGIRCNIGDQAIPYINHAGSFIGSNSRLGFSREEIARIPSKESINGLHLYAGTDIFDIDYLLKCYRELVEMTDWFPALEYLNFGGGFGISEDQTEQFDMERYATEVTNLMNETSEEYGKALRMILEPGRIIGAEAGYFVTTVTDIKERNGMKLIGVNASSSQFPRPLFYPDDAKHPVMVFRHGEIVLEECTNESSIYGCSTYSRDFLAKNVLLPEVQIGDSIVLGNAGSYCSSLHTRFLGFPEPKEYFV